MTLADLLPALSKNASLNITLLNDDGELITFNAAGYESIESDLNAKVVKNIAIDSNKLAKIKIADS